MNLDGKRVGLVLGGGGSRALAHFGVLRAMEERGIKPVVVAGASAGAIVGALYCAGLPCSRMLELRKLMSWLRVASPIISTTGIARLVKLGCIIEKFAGVELLEELPIPLRVSTTNLVTAKPVVHRRGRLGQVVSASCSIPGLFSPVIIDGQPHVDGSMSGNLPAFAIDDTETDVNIIVDPLRHCSLPANPKSFYRIVVQSFVISLKNSSPECPVAEDANIRIEPTVGSVDPFRFNRFDLLEKSGYEAACDALDKPN